MGTTFDQNVSARTTRCGTLRGASSSRGVSSASAASVGAWAMAETAGARIAWTGDGAAVAHRRWSTAEKQYAAEDRRSASASTKDSNTFCIGDMCWGCKVGEGEEGAAGKEVLFHSPLPHE